MNDQRLTELGARNAGEDPHDPYEDTDLEDLPEWWRHAIAEFEDHDLRPYRPPRFEDGTLKYRVVERLERDLDISIRFLGKHVSYGDDWLVEVDGSPIGPIERHRSPEGYSVFEMSASAFADWVQREV